VQGGLAEPGHEHPIGGRQLGRGVHTGTSGGLAWADKKPLPLIHICRKAIIPCLLKKHGHCHYDTFCFFDKYN
jgi:hypothetical protein